MLTDFHNYFTVRLSDNFATKVDQSYRYGFGGLVFFGTQCMSHIFICVHIAWANVHGVGEVSSRRNVS